MSVKKELIPQKIEKRILVIVNEKHPKTVEQLLNLLSKEYFAPKNDLMAYINLLQQQKKIIFVNPSTTPLTSMDWFFSSETAWFWVVTVLSIASMVTSCTLIEESSSIYYIRSILASFFILYLPGYSFIKALFTKKELDSIERTALNIISSISLVLAVAFVLNYTPWGIKLVPISISLFAVTLIFAIIALTREYRREFWKKPKIL